MPPSLPKETLILADMVAKVVYIVYEISRRYEVLTEVYLRILTTIRPSLSRTPASTTTVGRLDSV